MKNTRRPALPFNNATAALCAITLAAAGCGKDPAPAADAATASADTAGKPFDVTTDTTNAPTDAAGETPDAFVLDTSTAGKPGDPVAADLGPWLGSGAKTGAFVRKIADAKDLIGGQAAQGKLGDYVFGNGAVRYIIQGDDRHQGPCPWGGTVLDADVVRKAGDAGHDNVGEYCLLFHLGRTLLPKQFEILADGSKGGPAVLRITGPDTENDFIHLTGLVAAFVGNAIELPLNPDEDLPLTISRYFILRPDSPVLQVVTAIRNEGSAEILTHVGELADSGGQVEFFNPLSKMAGFGYGGFGSEPMAFLGFRGKESSHLLSPSPAADGGPGGAYLSVSGVAGMLFGGTDLMGLLLTPKAEMAAKPGAVKIAAGQTYTFSHAMVVGSGDLGTLTTPLWADRKVATGTVTGKVVDSDGKPIAGVRVSAILEGKPPRTMTQFVSGADGAFGGTLPPGSYRFAGDAAGRALASDAKATVEVGKEVTAGDVKFSLPGTLAIAVKDGGGAPSPAKVTVVCDGPCTVPQSSLHRDISFDKKPDTLDSDGDGKPDAAVFDIAFVPPDGKLDLPLPPGKYTVTLSRGPVYSLWPEGAGAVKAGQAVSITAGATAKIDAVLHKVVDTSGHLCGDFHVHAINSPDAPVPNVDRVLSMAAEGVDVMVSTDHDYVTDFGPAIAAAKAEAVLAAIPGVELTTFDYGHYNGFPMPVKAGDLNGGAPDWGNAEKAGMTPAQIAQALGAPDPARVAQINHPDGGYWKVVELDVLTGVTLADPTKFRMPAVVADPKTGDTKLFTNQFTAVEILNGYSSDKFVTCLGWWMPLLSTGTRFTGTAVSDTHNWTSSQSGGPRSWVRVGTGKDKVQGLDFAQFAKDINAGKVVGSSGPFVVVRATTEGNAGIFGVGDTVQLPAGVALPALVTLEVEVQAPQWMPFDTVELYRDVTEIAPSPGQSNSVEPKPRQKVTFKLQPEDLKNSADGSATAKRWVKKVTFTETVEKDAWLVVFVRGKGKLPVALVSGRTAEPFAYTNPIYVDVDGKGYDKTALPKHANAGAGKALGRLPWARKAAEPKRAPTWADFEKLREAMAHDGE